MKITVLIADDHEIVRNGLRLILEQEVDIEVIGEAEDGDEALHRIKGLEPDVALLDIDMPPSSGVEVTRQIQQSGGQTRVVILSMYADSEHAADALHAGALGYVVKRSAGSEVVDAIRTVAKGNHFVSKPVSDLMIGNYVRREKTELQQSPLDRLSPRERETLQLVVEGYSSVAIAEILHLSTHTVDTYRSRLMHKLNIDNLPFLVKLAIRHGLTGMD